MSHLCRLRLAVPVVTIAGIASTAPAQPGGEASAPPEGAGATATAAPSVGTEEITGEEALAMLASPVPEARMVAVRRLTELRDASVVPRLVTMLSQDPSEEVRRYAVVALANFANPASYPAIESAARSDPSPRVRSTASEALVRLGLAPAPAPPPAPAPAPAPPTYPAPAPTPPGYGAPAPVPPAYGAPAPVPPVFGAPAPPGPWSAPAAIASPQAPFGGEELFARFGIIRVGGGFSIANLWRTTTIPETSRTGSTEVESEELGILFAPTIGGFVTNYFELGLEFSIGYSSSGIGGEGELDTSTLAVAFLPLIRGHLPISDHFFFTGGLLLGYGRAEQETSIYGDRMTITSDGFVLAGEFGFELAVDGIVIPVWIRPAYRPWTQAAESGSRDSVEYELSDFVLSFGAGVGGYF